MSVPDTRVDRTRPLLWRARGAVVSGRETGRGARPVLVLHASGVGARAMDPFARALAQAGLGPILALDLPGYGDSRLADPAGMDWPALADFLGAALDAWGRTHVDLVGHSMGGLMALRLALADPGRVRRVVLIEPMVFGVLDPRADAEARAMGRLPRDWFADAAARGQAPSRAALARFVGLWGAPGGWEALSDGAKARLAALGPQIAREAVMVSRDTLAPAAAGKLAASCLLLGGGRSPLAAGAILDRLGEALPRAGRRTFPDQGHMLPLLDAPGVAAAVGAFLMGAPEPNEPSS